MPKLQISYTPRDMEAYLKSVVEMRDAINLEKNSNLQRKWEIGKKASNLFGIFRDEETGNIVTLKDKSLIKHNSNTVSILASQIGIDGHTLRNCIKFYRIVDLSLLRQMLSAATHLNKPVFTWYTVLLILRFEDNVERLNVINLLLSRKITVADLRKKLEAKKKPRKSASLNTVCSKLSRLLSKTTTELQKHYDVISNVDNADEVTKAKAAELHVIGSTLLDDLKKQNLLLGNVTDEE